MARLWPDHCPADSGLSVCTNSRRVAAWSTAWHCQLTCSVVQYLSATVRAESFSCLWLNPSEAKLSNVLSRQKKVTGAPPPGHILLIPSPWFSCGAGCLLTAATDRQLPSPNRASRSNGTRPRRPRCRHSCTHTHKHTLCLAPRHRFGTLCRWSLRRRRFTVRLTALAAGWSQSRVGLWDWDHIQSWEIGQVSGHPAHQHDSLLTRC